jgi:tRNA(adenine34) deaminase
MTPGSPSEQEDMDRRWMIAALEEAKRAFRTAEVPIGAVLVSEGQIIGRGRNERISRNDPTAHAEILALRSAATRIGNYRLTHATLYVTLEPCLMCFGALLEARVDTVVFGLREPKWGVAGSLYDLQNDPRFPHRIKVREGVLREPIGALLQAFFLERREHGRS